MNSSFVLEMVAARASASGNVAMADALARLRAQPDDLSSDTSQALLAQLGRNNPMVGALMKHMAESKAAALTHEPIEIDAKETQAQAALPVQPAAESDVGTAVDAVNELREHAQNMFAELLVLRRRSDSLAAALGACCLCWGQDVDCRNCHGRGAPGFSIPDDTQFEAFVLPAIRTLKALMSVAESRVRRVKESPPPEFNAQA